MVGLGVSDGLCEGAVVWSGVGVSDGVCERAVVLGGVGVSDGVCEGAVVWSEVGISDGVCEGAAVSGGVGEGAGGESVVPEVVLHAAIPTTIKSIARKRINTSGILSHPPLFNHSAYQPVHTPSRYSSGKLIHCRLKPGPLHLFA